MTTINDNLLFQLEFEEAFRWRLRFSDTQTLTSEFLEVFAESVSYPTQDLVLEDDGSGIIGGFLVKEESATIELNVFSDFGLEFEGFYSRWLERMFDPFGAFNQSEFKFLYIERINKLDQPDNNIQVRELFRVYPERSPTFEGQTEGLRSFQVVLKAIERIKIPGLTFTSADLFRINNEEL